MNNPSYNPISPRFKNKFFAVLLTITTGILSTTLSVVPFLVLILTDKNTESIKRRRILLFYKVLLATHIFLSVAVYYLLYGVVMEMNHLKKRMGLAYYIETDMMVYTCLHISVGEHIPMRPLFILVAIADVLYYPIFNHYKNTLGEAF